MDSKKTGLILMGLGLVLGVVVFLLIGQARQSQEELRCYQAAECKELETSLSISHLAIGALSFVFALGLYLALFSGSDKAIMKRLEEEKNKKLAEDKFSIVLMALDDYEKKVLKAVKDQDGITQSTLRLRTNLSKAKLSYVVNELERRGLIKRVKSNKTFAIHLSKNI